MGGAGAMGGCVLTPVAGAAGFWTAMAGTVNLLVVPGTGTGTVAIDAGNSSVSDITDWTNVQAVTFTADAGSFNFVAAAGRKYQVTLICTLLPSPYTAKATIQEPCGQVVATVDFLNPSPGLVVQA